MALRSASLVALKMMGVSSLEANAFVNTWARDGISVFLNGQRRTGGERDGEREAMAVIVGW